jgi:hypothetical protein
MIAVDALILAGMQSVSGALGSGVLSYNDPEPQREIIVVRL